MLKKCFLALNLIFMDVALGNISYEIFFEKKDPGTDIINIQRLALAYIGWCRCRNQSG